MTQLWEESLTEDEQHLLQPFVTNGERSVFGLRNLPEVIKGALFSRYSRSDKSLRRLLLDEFIQAPEADFRGIVGSLNRQNGASESNTEQLLAIQKAIDFYDRVLIGYGDDSVAELGGAHIACEGISNIAAKIIEDSRLGISPLEKSTRYVPFNRQVNGRYRYYREPSIMASSYAGRYESTLDNLFDTYTKLIEPLLSWVKTNSPPDLNASERAYNSAVKAKTLDLLRGLLPMATLTNVGLFGNGRAFEYLLVKLAASPHQEVRSLGEMMQQELDLTIPSFVKRAKSDRGLAAARYIATNGDRTYQLAQKLVETRHGTSLQSGSESTATVQLVEYDENAELKVVAAILYPQTDLPLTQIEEYVLDLSATERQEIINTYVGDRESRFHRPGRAFEATYYTFDILADLGAYRDLHRHRVLTQERQRYTVRHGYIVPREIEAANLDLPYRQALDDAAATFESIAQTLPEAAQYVVPLAYRTRWRIQLNLREVYHLVELRSSRQGHPSYRFVAQEIYRQINAVHPMLVANMKFVDLNDYELERLAAEQKMDVKLQHIDRK
jgi:thymidylate synthase ThyX